MIAFAIAITFLMPSTTRDNIPQGMSLESKTNAINAILQDFEREDDFIVRTDSDTGRITVEGWVDDKDGKRI